MITRLVSVPMHIRRVYVHVCKYQNATYSNNTGISQKLRFGVNLARLFPSLLQGEGPSYDGGSSWAWGVQISRSINVCSCTSQLH